MPAGQKRIVEAYVGEYASGKSENAVNRALALRRAGHQVTLVDLDMVEPCYCLRPLKKSLEAQGLTVLTWQTEDTFGLGEAGQTLLPQARWALRRPGDIIFDVGYGVDGLSTLNLVEELEKEATLQIVLVVNTRRPMTGSVELVREYIAELGQVDALLSNSHLAAETSPEVVDQGALITAQVGDELRLPLMGISVMRSFLRRYPDYQPPVAAPLLPLEPWLSGAFW